MAPAAAVLKKAAVFAVCIVLAMSLLQLPVTATYCSDCASQCTSTCNAQVTSSCESIRTTKYQECLGSCSRGYRGIDSSYCSSTCRKATDSGYSSCQSSVYQQCYGPWINGCNSNCTNG